MSKWAKCDIRQLQRFHKQLENLQKVELDEFCQATAKSLAGMMLARVKKRTPVGDYPPVYANPVEGYEPNKTGGTLRRSWFAGNVVKKGDIYEIEVYNTQNYADYVEFGHRQHPGQFVAQIGLQLKNGWVEGKFMMTITEKELQDLAPKYIEKKLTKFLERSLNGK